MTDIMERLREVEWIDTSGDGTRLSNPIGFIPDKCADGAVEIETLRQQLAAANERMEEQEVHLLNVVRAWNERLAAEREVSDKLEKALEIAIIGACAVGVPHNGERKVLQEAVDHARAALAEVAAIRAALIKDVK